jgi:hypothetical protein
MCTHTAYVTILFDDVNYDQVKARLRERKYDQVYHILRMLHTAKVTIIFDDVQYAVFFIEFASGCAFEECVPAARSRSFTSGAKPSLQRTYNPRLPKEGNHRFTLA